MHGSIARGTRARAEYLSLVAEGLEKKLLLLEAGIAAQVYSADVRERLRLRGLEISKGNSEMKRREAELKGRLEVFEGIRGLAGIANVYTEVERERGRVEEEIARLEEGEQR